MHEWNRIVNSIQKRNICAGDQIAAGHVGNEETPAQSKWIHTCRFAMSGYCVSQDT